VNHPTLDLSVIFNALPGNHIVLKPDAPIFTILAVSDAFLVVTSRTREELLGKSLFDVFPENPETFNTTGPTVLKHSLQNAIRTKKEDQMPIVRYDLSAADGGYEERYWLSCSRPVTDENSEVLYLIHTTTDVSEQVKAENAQRTLRKIEKTYNLFIQAPVAVSIMSGPDYIIELANPEILRYWGKTEDVVGKSFVEVYPDLKERKIYAVLDEVRTSGKTVHVSEYPSTVFVNEKEEIRYFNIVYKPYYANDSDPVPSGVFILAHDITEQVEARIQVEESEQRVRSLIESIPYPIGVYIGSEMRIQYANQSMIKSYGKGSNVVGRLYAEVLPELAPQVYERLNKVYTTGNAFHIKNEYITLVIDGKPCSYYFNYSFTPLFDTTGQVYGIINTAIDVTDLNMARLEVEESQKALKRFKFMADQARDAFILMRQDGTFAYLNQKALEAWGYTEEEARHIRVPDVDPIYQDDMFSQAFARAQKEIIPQFETLHKRKDGHIYPVEVNMGGLTLGDEPHMFAVARNITERKLAEEALEAKNSELIRINNDMDNFIYTASHDLKAPISNIEGLLQALLRTLPAERLATERTRHITSMMQTSVDRFKKTISSLTEVVKLQKESSIPAVSVNIARVLHEVELDLEPLIQATHTRIISEVSDCTVHFPEKNLRSVIYNLLSNSIKYRTPHRQAEIHIHCDEIPGYNRLTITDNGLGIKEAQLPKLFTMFKRFHDHVEGSGIGLYMVKKMVDNVEGRIEVESKEGEGTTFKVYFPR
jgi:two-component system, sensor histidine kinase